jgi:hypothetical protein
MYSNFVFNYVKVERVMEEWENKKVKGKPEYLPFIRDIPMFNLPLPDTWELSQSQDSRSLWAYAHWVTPRAESPALFKI